MTDAVQYHERRAGEHRKLAAKATDEAVRKVHLELVERHTSLARSTLGTSDDTARERPLGYRAEPGPRST